MEGFAKGVEYYNAANNKSVKVLGWDTKTKKATVTLGSFDDTTKALATSLSLEQQGADFIFPVAGNMQASTSSLAIDAMDFFDPSPDVVLPSLTLPMTLSLASQNAVSTSSVDAVAPEIGNALPMKSMPLGTNIHNIEMQPGQGGKMARSAGSSAQLANKEEKYAVLKMPSGELRKVLINCYATVGVVSNSDHNLETAGKAGRNRWKGIRPRVRGVAMNPVDHPMGGGEGRASGGHPRSRNGKYAKGEKTRTRGKGSDKLIIQRRDGKKLAK
jgi:hypothetical protein